MRIISVGGFLVLGLVSIAAAATPPPPPGQYSTRASAVARGVGTGACQNCPIVVGGSSGASTDPSAGVRLDVFAQAGNLSTVAAATHDGPSLSAAGGSRVDDYIYIDATSLTDGSPVPIHVTLLLEASGTYSFERDDQPLPFGGVSATIPSFGAIPLTVAYQIGRYGDYYQPNATLDTSLPNRSWFSLTYFLNSGVDVHPNGFGSAVNIGGVATINIIPFAGLNASAGDALSNGVSLYSASGYDYTLPVPELPSRALLLVGVASLAVRILRRRSSKRPGYRSA